MKKLVVAILLLNFAPLWATDYTWTGGGTEPWWNDAANWGDAGIPGTGDKAIFNLKEGASCLVLVDADKNPFHDIEVWSGTVTITNGATSGFPRFAKGTNTLFVADNAELVFNCHMKIVSNGAAWLWKTGAGTMKGPPYGTGFDFGGNGAYDYAFREIWVKDGVFTMPSARVYSRKFVLEDGATLNAFAGSTFNFWEILEVKKGATANLTSFAAERLAGLCGDGQVVLSKYDSSHKFMALSLFQGPYRFAGTIKCADNDLTFHNYQANAKFPAADEERDFVIASTNALAEFAFVHPVIPLSFAAGLGEFWTGCIQGEGAVPVVTADEDGEPIRLHAGIDADAIVAGAGDWFAPGTTTITGQQVRVTGFIGSDVGGMLKIGNGKAGGDADISTVKGVVADGTVDYASAGGLTQDAPVTGKGEVRINQPTTLNDLRTTGTGYLRVNGTGTVAGGDASRGRILIGSSGNLTVTGPKTRIHGEVTAASGYAGSAYPLVKPLGLRVEASGADSRFTVADGAEIRCSTAQVCMFPSFSLTDGGRIVLLANGYWRTSDKEDSYTVWGNGGVIRLCSWNAQYGFGFPYEPEKWTLSVGEKGFRFDYADTRTFRVYGNYRWDDSLKAVSGVAAPGRDGGIVFAAPGVFRINKPQGVTGPVRIEDGRLTISQGAVDGAVNKCALGTGDFILAGGCLAFEDETADMGVRLAAGDGSRFVVEQASRVDWSVLSGVDPVARKTPQTVTADGAFVRARDGVLFVTDNAHDAVDGSHGKLLVGGNVDCFEDGRTKAPVFTQAGRILNDKLSGRVSFAKYDAALGFVEYANYADGTFDDAADKVVRLRQSGETVSLTESKSVAGLLIDPDGTSTWKPLTLDAATTLTVGDGVNPACILVGTGHFSTITAIEGGTVDFGSSEGVIAIGERANWAYSAVPTFDTCLAGRNGVTFASVANVPVSFTALKRASTYEGGTTIGGVGVRIYDGQALGRGAVTVSQGRTAGAQVAFMSPMTVANDFTIAGSGMPEGATNSEYPCGALAFKAEGEVRLTGDVLVDGYARVSTSRGADKDYAEGGVFEGVVSGGKLEVLNTDANGGAPVVFTRSNDYTNGTDIFCARVVLRGTAPSLGTGDVLMDRAWLCFENTAALTFANTVTGSGTVVLKGSDPVSFTGDVSGFSAVLDLAGTKQTFTAFPSFATEITNSSTTPARLILAPGLGTVCLGGRAISGKIDLEIGEGTLLDLGGADVTVRRCYDGAAKRVINGTLHETKPLQGLMVILR